MRYQRKGKNNEIDERGQRALGSGACEGGLGSGENEKWATADLESILLFFLFLSGRVGLDHPP